MRISDWSSDVCSSDLPQYRRKRRSAPHETHRGQPPRRASTSRVTGRRADGSTSRVTRLRRDRGRRTKWREARAAATPPADLAAPQDRWLPRQKGSVPLAQVPPASCPRSEEHTPELQSLKRISSAVSCLKKKT